MSNKLKLAAVAFAAISLIISASANASIFFDGFESPSQVPFGGYSYGGTDSAGANFINGTGIQANGSAFGYANAPEGIQTAHIQGTGIFTESITGLAIGQSYTLSFYEASRAGYPVDPIMVFFDSASVPNLLTSTPGSTDFTLVSTIFQATATSGLLSFSGTIPQTGGDFNAAVDAISISAVPEPATWAMMMLGFVGIGFMSYRRSRRSAAIAT